MLSNSVPLNSWSRERTLALPGRVHALVIRGWAQTVEQRWGRPVLAELQDRTRDLPLTQVDGWLPAGAWLALVDAITELCGQGKLANVEEMIRTDALQPIGPLRRRLIRAAGPMILYRQAENVCRRLHDVGQVRVECDGPVVKIKWQQAELFDHPTWRGLQLLAHRTLLDLAIGRDRGQVSGNAENINSFSVHVVTR